MDGDIYRPHRRRLPNRRTSITEDIEVGNTTLSATIGLDQTGRPRELFLSGAKDGSGMAAVLNDASVVISIALQWGIPIRTVEEHCPCTGWTRQCDSIIGDR
jgi:ribonucleoside-diphosphate reductase alpha chain